jgi:hypothetical protein
MPGPEEQKQPARPDSSDTPAPESSSPDTVLGRVGAGPHDTRLSAPAPGAATSHRKGTHPSPSAETPAGQAAPSDTDRLRLPRGGLVALRESGGLLFRSREIAVYRSGKLVYRRLAPTVAEPITRHAPLSDLVQLHYLLKQIDFSKLAVGGRQNPDAFAYELVARVGRAVKFVEVFEGSIPEALAPLIRELRRLMPADQ